ncbi:MAG: D-2-hydroxyacid dehydrogenase [Pseudorhodoplanes sp.]|uniref:D-2-hydroxyacid dehydrogenase n=1 Tax=Pseudorhodoplanes sp. TaxID=1934341 RepID=UPI003D103B18
MDAPKVGLTFRLPTALVSQLREQFPAIGFAGPGLEAPFRTSEANVILGWPKPDFVQAATSLKWIQLFAAGTDIVDFQNTLQRGIVVTNARGVGSPSIAEHVLAMMLHFNRRMGLLLRAQLEGCWIEKNSFDYPELNGQSLAVVGAGSIGTEIARRARALGMRAFGINRDGRAVDGFERTFAVKNTAEAIGKADHVVVCVPGHESNARAFDAEWFSHMKSGAYFYNVGRGNAVDETALLSALDSDHIAGAGLDVTDVEPLPAGHPFWKHPKVLLTQHKAMNSARYWERLTQLFADNLVRFTQGRPLVNIVQA